ncbi:hypothetical protein D9M69_714020 [compost metagenome]
MAIPWQVLQRGMARFAAQPEGTEARFAQHRVTRGSLGITNFPSLRLVLRKMGLRRGRTEASTDPT